MNLDLINNSALTLLFSALGLESHINAFGQKLLGPKYFEEIDRLSPAKKFRIATDLVSGKKEWLSSQVIGDLRRLFSIRDKLVHYKTTEANTDNGTTIRQRFFIEEKELGLRVFELAVVELHKLDPDSDIRWLNRVHTG